MSSATSKSSLGAPERSPIKPSLYHRQSSTLHYQTFPTAPPRNPGRQASKRDLKAQHNPLPPPREDPQSPDHGSPRRPKTPRGETPLPVSQLAILAVIALAEQTALNSISPYLPAMVSSFPEVPPARVGLYVGLIASTFALAQFLTNFAWGLLSDRIGRKPVVLTGTFLTACCFLAFGFCKNLKQALIVQGLMGLVNGNQVIVSTCLGEITDRSNQSRAFTYLPVIYGLGGITGPIVGGLLIREGVKYPYLLPNLLSAGVLAVDLVLTIIFLRESLECAKDLPPLHARIGRLFAKANPTSGTGKASTPQGNGHTYSTVEQSDDTDSTTDLFPTSGAKTSSKDIFNRDTILLLTTFSLFQLSNIAYNSLYPIFAASAPPTGRDLGPDEIGISLAFAGAFTIVFQIGVFGQLREKIGNRITYRVGLGGFVVAFILMPFVGYKTGTVNGDGGVVTSSGKGWLWAELGVVLIIKTIAAVSCLTSALLLITNSAPSHAVLGTLNGLAQTLSAAGRAVGPFLSGGLFSAATNLRPKGEALPFGVFAGVAFVATLLSFGIRGKELEAEGWEEEGDGDEDEETTLLGDQHSERR